MKELLLKYIKGMATPEERQEVFVWIVKDIQNRQAYETLLMAYMMSIWDDDHLPESNSV